MLHCLKKRVYDPRKCLNLSVESSEKWFNPEERQVASVSLNKTLCLAVISKCYAIMKQNFRCLYHCAAYIMVINIEIITTLCIPVDMFFVFFYPSNKVLEKLVNDV